MKQHWIKPALWLSMTCCGAVAAFSAGQFPVDPGEKILNSACTMCHELRPIETSAFDSEAWTKVVNVMVEKGADVKKVNRRGQTTVDMANGPVQRTQPYPETIKLLESMGAKNNNRCVSC